MFAEGKGNNNTFTQNYMSSIKITLIYSKIYSADYITILKETVDKHKNSVCKPVK